MSRPVRSLLTALVLASMPLALAACQAESDKGTASMKSAGGLSEARWPKGLWGDTPAPTAALPKDESLKQGWYKRAKKGDKAPTAGNRASM